MIATKAPAVQRVGTLSIPTGIPRGLAISARIAAWALVCVAVTTLVVLLQTQNRAPLTWDEATRVRAGQEFVFALRSGGLPAVRTWANEQVFYPFVAPLMHGLVLLFVDDPVVAAWVPAVAAYAALGLLAGALAKELQFGSRAAWIAAGLCWTTPLYARLAAGGFIDTLGACASVASVVLVVRSLRTSRVLDAALAGALCVLTFLIRYDFGLVLVGAVAITALRAGVQRQSNAPLKVIAIIFGTIVVLTELWFIQNASVKTAGFIAFFSGSQSPANVKVSLDNWTYYLGALWYNPEVGLSGLIADLTVVAVVWGGIAIVHNPRLTAPVAFIAVWFVMYSAAGSRNPQFARYMASVLPFGFVVAGTVLSRAATSLQWALSDRRVARRLAQIAVLVFAFELLRQTAGPSGIAQQFWFIQPNPAAADIVEFLANNLGSADSSLLLLGETNEVSPDLVRLVWMRTLGRSGQRVVIADWLSPDTRRATLHDRLRRENIDLVLAVRVGQGSRFDTTDFRARSASQGGFERYAEELAGSSNFSRIAGLTLEDGRLDVMLWRVARAASGGPGRT